MGFSWERSSHTDQPQCSETPPKRLKRERPSTSVDGRSDSGDSTRSAPGAHDTASSVEAEEQQRLLGVVECTPDTFCTQRQVCNTCAYCIAHRIGNRSSTGRNGRLADTTSTEWPEW